MNVLRVVCLFLWLTAFSYSNEIKLGCLVTTYNRLNLLKTTLESLKKTEIPENVRIYLCISDDCSSDSEVIKYISEYTWNNERVVVYKLFANENRGVAQNIKRGVKYIKNKEDPEFYVTLDSDMLVNKKWIESLLNVRKEFEHVERKFPVIYSAYNSRLHHVFKQEKKIFNQRQSWWLQFILSQKLFNNFL